VYHLADPKQGLLRCRQQQRWKTTPISLLGTGILRNAASCHVTTEEVQLYPKLSGETVFLAQNSLLHTPSLPAVASTSELQVLKITEMTKIGMLAPAISSHRMQAGVNTLFHKHSSQIPNHEGQTGTPHY
jgi:hypothetical protein